MKPMFVLTVEMLSEENVVATFTADGDRYPTDEEIERCMREVRETYKLPVRAKVDKFFVEDNLGGGEDEIRE